MVVKSVKKGGGRNRAAGGVCRTVGLGGVADPGCTEHGAGGR